jgi:phage terminase small subunit
MLHDTEKTYYELLAQLNTREAKFVAEFLACGNAAQAARKAGYSDSSAHTSQQIGYENMLKPDVTAAIQAGLNVIAHRCEVNADKIVKDLATIAFSNIAHYRFDDEGYVSLEEGAPSEALRAIQSVKRRKRVLDDGSTVVESELRLWDKVAALTLLGKKLRLWIDRVETENAQDAVYKILLQQLKEGGQSN